ncbi:hypothetical protein DAMA08_034620 [Martiniozyma asiatica (nom. inval.)]|nr:hypothetical protein DAMA08_034620 [Martiniozyma asiatica]
MFGLKAAKKARTATTQPVDIPGFSKWIANEVYVQDSLTGGTLEQLALNMMQNVEWINETMNDVLNLDLPKINDDNTHEDKEANINEKEEVIEQVVDEIQAHKKPSADLVDPKIPSDNLTEKSSNTLADLELPLEKENKDSEINTLLLKSPKKIRNKSSSPLKRLQDRELEVLKNSLSIESAQKSNTSVTNEPKTQTVKKNDILSSDIDDDNYEDISNSSFAAISRNIRKSILAKQRQLESDENSQLIIQNLEVNSTTVENDQAKDSPLDEIKEISKLIDKDQPSSDSNSDGDLSIAIDQLEKIEYSEVKRQKRSDVFNSNIDVIKSPIKFSELPTREPLVHESSRRATRISTVSSANRSKSIATVIEHHTPTPITKKHSSPIRKVREIKEFDNDSIFVDKSGVKVNQKGFALNLPPGKFVNDLEDDDEPTIKLNRNFRKSVVTSKKSTDAKPLKKNEQDKKIMTKTPNAQRVKQQMVTSAPHMTKAPVDQGPRQKNSDFISRLMKPTESSLKRARETISPVKLKGRKILKEDTTTQIVPLKGSSPKSSHKFERSKSLGVGIGNGSLTSISSSSSKKSIPLTMKSLKSASTEKDAFINNAEPKNTSPKRHMLAQSLKKVNGSNLDATVKNNRKMKSITKTIVNQNFKAKSKILKPGFTAETKKIDASKVRVRASEGLTANELPEIESGNEEEGNMKIADWGKKAILLSQLKNQQKINPKKIFGKIEKVDCEAIFGKKYNEKMNIEWLDKDKLSSNEIINYEKSMGWRN